jgi:hypothetical protein
VHIYTIYQQCAYTIYQQCAYTIYQQCAYTIVGNNIKTENIEN